MCMTEIKWCKMLLVWCLEERDLEKKNIIMVMLEMAWEEHGWRREDAPRILAWWYGCIKLQAKLETQSRERLRKQPLVSVRLFISLVGPP